MRITDKGSSQRAITRDGYLVVPATISKLGVFDYHAQELGLPDSNIKKVARTENSLFTDRTLASFEGVPITIGHPEQGVNAKNWKQLAVGTVRNVKRVEDSLTAEAWIYDETAIKLIQDKGVEELSCGYDCDVIALTDGSADFEMSPMIGNHVAIVAKGRCGGSVKLADEDKTFMGKTVKFFDTLLGAFGLKLSDEQKKQLEEEEEKQPDNKEKSEEGNKPKPNAKENDDKASEPDEKEKKNVADEALKQQLADAQKEIQRLKDEKTQTENKATVLSDAQAVFPNVKFADSDNVRQIHEKVILDQKLHTVEELKTLSDEAVAGAYGVAKKIAKANLGEQVGRALMGDSATVTQGLNFNQLYNSK